MQKQEKGLHVFSNRTALSQPSAIFSLGVCGLVSAVFFSVAAFAPAYAFPKLSDPTSVPTEQEEQSQPEAENESTLSSVDAYLDKLMMAESAGKPHAKNPRSTALGPFQFINSTFIAVVDRHFSDEVEGLNRSEILALRTDMEFSRKAATAFNNDNANYLRERGFVPTFAHLRLSHLLGAPATVKVLKAGPGARLTKVLPSAVIKANPFMRRLTVAGLVNRAEREVGVGTWTNPNEIAQTEDDVSSARDEQQQDVPATTEVADDETQKAL